jgi:uncharacterized membrane protein YkoI
MIKKAIVAIVVIVAAAALVFAALPADQKNSTNNSANSSSEVQQNSANNTTIADNGITPKTDNATNISATEAKKIAGKYIDEPGAYAGTPKLSTQGGNLVYVVPVIYNEKIVGEIDIDAQSGKNVGGAGGAP